MRHTLIEWLIDDVAPRVRRSGDPEGELLKFASEKNLSPALLEGLGQLFNTAKTLCYMEKNAASRGGSFPTVDVQNLVSQYLEVPATKMKEATGWAEADDKLQPGDRMPDFFALPENDGLEFHLPKSASFRKQSLSPLRANIATAELVKTDMEESARGLLDRLVKKARRSQLDWNTLELDALAVLGDEAKPALDNAANYLAAHNIKVARQTFDGKPRFVESDLVEIEFLAKSIVGIKEAGVMLAEMKDELQKSSAALAKDEVDEEDDEGGEQPPKPVAPRNPGRGTSGKDLGGSPFEFLPKGGDPSKSVLKTAPDAMFNMLAPARDHFFKGVLKHISTPGDQHADSEAALGDAQHLSLLQNLLTTDDVLSEADPDQVVSAYNTIRQTAPHLAKDVNVMRVALRSAVQHEGIDPFTIKGIAETETARQKAVAPARPAKPSADKE